jgi:hypothetical protein
MYSTSAQPTGVPFSPGQVALTPVGRAEFSFADVDHGTLNYTFNGVGGQRALTRFVFDASGNATRVDYSDVWWVPAESGWGLTVTQQFQTLFANWRTYDANGRPIRFLMPGGTWIGPATYRGTLYRTASTPTGAALSQGVVSTVAAGSATLTFIDADNAIFEYQADGVAGVKNITRLRF